MKLKGFLDPADAIVPCKNCGAVEGQPCRASKKDTKPLKGSAIHFSRRVSRLLLTARRPDLRSSLEREAVKMLQKHLKEKRT